MFEPHRIVDAHDVELFVLGNAEIERRERCVIIPYADYGDALRPTRDRRSGNLPGHGREGKAANSKIARTSHKLATIVRIEGGHDNANYTSG